MATGPENRAKIINAARAIEYILDNPPSYASKIRLQTLIIKSAAADLKRRPQHRTPTESDPVTPQKRAAVLREKRLHPDLSLRKIGHKYNLNNARVSEILYGKRK